MSPNVHGNGWNGIDEEVDMVIERRVHATDPLNATSLRFRRGKQIRTGVVFFLFLFFLVFFLFLDYKTEKTHS